MLGILQKLSTQIYIIFISEQWFSEKNGKKLKIYVLCDILTEKCAVVIPRRRCSDIAPTPYLFSVSCSCIR